MRGLTEPPAHLGAGARLGQLPQHLDALRLEQSLCLLDLFYVQNVSHRKNNVVRKKSACQ
ncbi:hypothetical protein [Nonomuraea dietziae]|uniref:hypothetical protein n=1 Tax=Nonomuraea dietziae TaxID=65515 RepID=UPI0031D980DD